MAITTLSAREFNQKLGLAKKAAKKGPVFVTARGRATHVLLDVEEYRKIAGKKPNLAEALGNKAAAEIELEIAPRTVETFRDVDFD